jgi:hypothetical protein
VYQLVLASRFEGRHTLDPFEVYRALRLLNPSPYLFYCELGELTVVGSSPEALVKSQGVEAQLRPIAGSRPRGADATRDAELAAELQDLPHDGLRYLARDANARHTHLSTNLARPREPRGRPDPHAFTAQQKLIDARTLEEALEWFTPVERIEVAGDARLLNQLAALPDAPRYTLQI